MLHPNYLSELEYRKSNLTITTGASAILKNTSLGYNLIGGSNGIDKVQAYTSGLWMHGINIKKIKNTENTYLAGSVINPIYYVFGNKLYIYPTTGISAVNVFIRRMPAPLYAQYVVSTASTTAVNSATTGLSATADHYNGAVLYNVTKAVYYSCYDYTSGAFSIHTTQLGAVADANDVFYIINDGFETENLSTVTCELNPMFHEIVVMLAEAECWARGKNYERRNVALNDAISQISEYNASAMKKEGIGTDNENT
jgi:hypothetical protein